MSRRRPPVVRAVVLVLCLSACASEPPSAGHERGRCRADRGCDDGLACWSERCVRPPGADCVAVGARLAAVESGDHAGRPRGAIVQQLTGACRTARLTAAEGACLIEATTDDELGRCPRALLPALAGDRRGCERLAAHVASLTRAELARRANLRSLLGPVIDQLGPTVTRSCVEDRWTDETKACVQDATGYDDGEACLDQLDPADRRALERRLTMLVKRGMAMP